MTKSNIKLLLCILFCSCLDSSVYVNDGLIYQDKPPKKLSEYGFFQDMNNQIPSDGVLPYDLISPLFSDYADKLRFIYIPENKTAAYRQNKVFDFPNGTALIKTFAYLNNYQNSNISKQLLETRLLIKKNNEWVNVSYIWNDDQNEAFLSIAGKTISTKFINEYGNLVDVRYRVPNINQCKECHTSNKKITPIGPKARNLNKSFNYFEGSKNQLMKWHQMGWVKII